MAPLVLKRSPFILIKTFVAIEFLAFICYLLLLGHGSLKYDIYSKFFFFSNLIPYDIAKLIILAAAQLFITVYAFASWYYEAYTIHMGSIEHQWGVLWRKKKTVPLPSPLHLTMSYGPLGKFLHYGTIQVHGGISPFRMLDISNPGDQVKLMQNVQTGGSFKDGLNIQKILGDEEHEHLEFKSSLRFDVKNGQVNRGLEKAAMKTISAFLNSKGGELIIGVDNTKRVLGLKNDYATMQNPNSDGFENHFTQVFNSMIGPGFRNLLRISFHKIGTEEVCLVQVNPASRPAYLKTENGEHFYVRTGNISTPLTLSEVETYAISRWPGNRVFV
jgi:membrane protein YdbS with pleckstrin-like domain